MSYPAIVFTDAAGDAWIDAINRMTTWNVDLYPEPGTKLAKSAASDGSVYAHIVGADRHEVRGVPRLAFRRLVTHADGSESYDDTTEHICADALGRIEIH